MLLASRHLAIGGVPIPIITKFLNDETARDAYFRGDSRKLHERLQAMGVEAQIKAFYQPQFHNEVELDQNIHQILYDRTGYVGKAYQVNEGILTLKELAPEGFDEWFKLAREVGLVSGSLNQDGIQYVVNSQGLAVPYEDLAAIFSLSELRSLRNNLRSLVETQ